MIDEAEIDFEVKHLFRGLHLPLLFVFAPFCITFINEN